MNASQEGGKSEFGVTRWNWCTLCRKEQNYVTGEQLSKRSCKTFLDQIAESNELYGEAKT